MPRRSPAALLLVASLTLGAAACAAHEGDPGPAVGTTPAAASLADDAATPGPAEGLTGDVALVARAVATSEGLARALDTARRRYPRLRRRLAPLARVHAEHRRVLVTALPEGAAESPDAAGRGLPPTPRPARALALLRQREQQAGRQLTGLAVEARSGRFARLLASMAAATAQVRIRLGASPAEGGGAARSPGGPGTPGSRTDPRRRSAEGAATALRDALAAEHAAVWLYGVLGARTSASGAPATFVAVEGAYDAHRARRNGLVAELRGLGADPVAASPTYRLPERVESLGTVRRLARRVEATTAGWWSALVVRSVGPLRRDAAVALADAAVRRLGFGAPAQAFPGAPELAGD